MSSEAVRAAFRDRWPDYAPGLLRLEVINTPLDADALGALAQAGTPFGTILFSVESRRDVSLGTQAWVEEQGLATISVRARSGEGDGQVSAIVTAIQARLAGRLLAPDVLVTEAIGPLDDTPQAEGEFYQQQLAARYVWQGREPRLQGV